MTMNTTYADRGVQDWTETAEWAFMNGLVAAALIYTLVFNFLDEGLRTSIAGALAVLIVARCALLWAGPASRAAMLVFLCVALLIGFFFIFLMDPRFDATGEYPKLGFRFLVGFAIMLAFTFSGRVISPLLLMTVIVTITVAGAFVALTGDPILYAEVVRPAVFTGGIDGVHSTAYALTAAFLGLATLRRSHRVGTTTFIALSLPLLILIILYHVRTCHVMILSYFAVTSIVWMRENTKPGYWLFPLVLFSLAIAMLSLASQVIDYSSFSSGRSEAYWERLEVLAHRPPLELFFGTGMGSEMMTSSVWWWEKKNSHNDFIDITIQLGLIGLALVLVLLSLTASHLNRMQAPLFVSFVVSSAVSNGLLGRPFLALLLLAFMGLAEKRSATIGT